MPGDKEYWSRKRHSAPADLWSGGGRGFRAWMKAGLGRKAGQGFPWGFVVLASGVLMFGFFTIPLGWAVTQDSCTAFETAFLRRPPGVVLGASHQTRWHTPPADAERRSISHGMVGREIGRMEYPQLPQAISCTILFWQVRLSG